MHLCPLARPGGSIILSGMNVFSVRNRLHMTDAYDIATAKNSRQIVSLIHIIHNNRKVRLPMQKHLTDFFESKGSNQNQMLKINKSYFASSIDHKKAIFSLFP
jgi:hypothetical protein